LRFGDAYLTVEVSVRPGSGRRGLLKMSPRGPVVGVQSAPEKGRANRELIEFIAEAAGVRTAAVSIIKGQAARRKVIRIETAMPQAIGAKLKELVTRA
jgi:uncharacterized protein